MSMNVLKGWPLGVALEMSYPPADGEAIVAGMAVKLNVAGELIKATGAAKEVASMALDAQSAFDVVESGKLAVLIGNAMIQTDQFVAGAYPIGTELEVSAVAPGLVRVKTVATAPTYGWVQGTAVVDGVTMLTILKPIPFGVAA